MRHRCDVCSTEPTAHERGYCGPATGIMSWLPCDQEYGEWVLLLTDVKFISHGTPSRSPFLIHDQATYKERSPPFRLLSSLRQRHTCVHLLVEGEIPTMPGPVTSLVPPHYNAFINSDKSESRRPSSPSNQSQFKMYDSASLAIFDGMVSDATDYNHIESFPPQTFQQAGFPPWTPWSEIQQLATQERTTYGYRSDPFYTPVPIELSYQALEQPKPTKYEPWTQGIHQEQAPSASYPDFPVIYGFPTDHDSSQMASMRRPVLPLPIRPRQRPSWNDAGVANTRNDIVAPRPRHSYVFPSDAADASGPSLCSPAPHLQADSSFAMKRMCRDVDDTVTLGSCETDSESAKVEPPYAKLIYNALMDAPEHKLVLKDIYAWINDNTDKAKDPAFKGWQNSVRHNLSMNGVHSCCHE